MTDQTRRDEALIIAYLTGQASEAESLQFRARIANDPEFASQVEELEIWLAPLDQDIEETELPDNLLDQIMDTIAADAVTETSAPDLPPPPANDTSDDMGTLRVWRAVAIAASLIAIASIGLHLVPTEPGPDYAKQPVVQPEPLAPPQSLLALLSGESPSPLVAIVYNPETGQVVARLSNVDIPEDGDLQLWLIRDGEPAPVSLGLLERTDSGQIEIESPASLNADTDILAVSLEALGGSRSAGPEGPVLFTGAVSQL